MKKTTSHIANKKRIMRRVYAVWFFKQITSPFFVRIYIFAAVLIGLTRSVSIRDVFINSPGLGEITATASYLIRALIHTEVVVQIYIFAALALLAWIFGEKIQNMLAKKDSNTPFAAT